MSETKFSKLLSNHEKYHHNPIIYKTKSYTFWYTIHNKGGKSSNLNTIKGHIKYIDNRPVYYVNYGPNFELEIISNHSSSDAAMKTQRVSSLLFDLHLKQIQKNRPQSNYIRPLKQFNELSISTKKAHARTIAKKIKKDFNQIAKENYHPNNQVILKELSYTVANTPFQVEFGSQNIIEKNKHESAIVQIIDKYQISRDGYHALLAIQPNLPRDYAVSDQFKKAARRSIKDVLLYLHPYLVANKILYSSKPVINLQISGDGYNVRKKINHVIITLAILDQKKELYLSNNHYTIVIYSDIKKYELLKSATQPLVDELNELQQSGFVDKNEINWLINLYFSSDWKFLILCLDMNLIASNSLAYPGHIRAPLFPMISLNHWNGEYNDDMRETICNEMKKYKVKFEFWKTTKWEYTLLLGLDKLKNKFDQLYCAIKNPDIDFTQFALDAKEWEAYFL
ncbi:30431_t:CDS:2 [Gigaspora margarita]|uniref:30431_t:CDS:1 n=1 Tax=Gigaspora margarita TaxID=4874 RepID=A0ABN7VGH5_GIGMA|nr:30431_t:CDS:2 [Gigaspora margarita]